MKLNEVRSVKIDNVKGMGAVPYNQEVDYMGMRVKMKPSTFLDLASEFTPNKEDLKYIKDNIKSGAPVASPFLDIDIKDDPPYKVVGHEGRHRMVAIQDVFGDYPVEVHLFFRGGVRNRDLTTEIIQDMNKGMLKQQSKNLIKGPLFESNTTLNENIKNTEAGEWLKKYTYDGISKFPNESIIDYLMQNYSNKKPLTIYRGLHFDDKEQYDEFMTNLKENNYQIRTKNISSWTPSFETAEDFALTKKSYYPTASIMSQEQERSVSKEYMTGYRGVVLEANIGPHSGIMVSDTPYAKEDEVILPKGTYKVKINATTKRFSDILGDGEETVVGLIDKMLDPKYKDDDYHKKFFDFITHNYSKDIQQSEELKNKVYQIFINRVKKSNKDFVKVEIQENIFGKYNEVRIFFNYSLFDLADKGFLPSKKSGALQKYADKIVQEYYNTVKKYNGPDYVYDLGLLNRIVKKYASPKMDKMADEIFQIQVGNAYQMLNDKSNIDNINSITDPKEKRKVMNDFTEKMKMILGQVK